MPREQLPTIGLFPFDCSDVLSKALAKADIDPKPLSDLSLVSPEEIEGWGVLIVELGDQPKRRLRHLATFDEEGGIPVLVITDREFLPMLANAPGIGDLMVEPVDHAELALRVERLCLQVAESEVLVYRDLELNTRTYQATLGGENLNLTYMEYELLRFLVENQGRVWSRIQLLSKVWGLEYFGGARTVDVHIRRLRVKLGEDRDWIVTVRSVGYRLS